MKINNRHRNSKTKLNIGIFNYEKSEEEFICSADFDKSDRALNAIAHITNDRNRNFLSIMIIALSVTTLLWLLGGSEYLQLFLAIFELLRFSL